MRVRVAVVSESFDVSRGGAERGAVELAAALAGRGHQVAAIHGVARGFRAAPRDAAGVRTIVSPASRGPGSLVRALRFARKAGATARRDGHDLVVGVGRLLGADVLIPHGGLHLATVVHALSRHRGRFARTARALARLSSPKQWLLLALERSAFRRASGVKRYVAVSRMVADHMVRLGGVAPETIAMCPNGADVERFRPPTARERASARAEIGVRPTEMALLFVSHHFELRGLSYLLRAMGRLRAGASDGRTLRLLVVGRGNARAYARSVARAGLDGAVRFDGPVEDVGPHYRAADLLVHPTFYDPCSLVTLEALASGLPVATTRWNGAAERFSGGEGRIIEDPRDEVRLAGALGEILDAPDGTRRAMGEAARATALAAPAAEALERLCELIEGVAAPAGAVSCRP